jgi:LAGLIDADG endonuclease
VTGAENQQERLSEFRGWVIGFVDGEGCFSIGFVRQPSRTGRRGYKTGYQVTHDFVVTQGASSVECLEELRDFFGVGQVYVNRRSDNHRENLYRYSVTRRQDLLETIIPFFRDHPLRTAKRLDFEKFASCVERMAGDLHKTREGLVEIVEIAETMNRRKPRHELIRILRDHTPDALDIGR